MKGYNQRFDHSRSQLNLIMVRSLPHDVVKNQEENKIHQMCYGDMDLTIEDEQKDNISIFHTKLILS